MFNFYMIVFYLKYFPGNIFVNSLSFAIADFVSYLVSGIIVKRTTTTKALIIAYSISLVGAICYLIFRHIEGISVGLIPVVIILSRVGNSMSFNTIYVTNNRLFPTTLMATSFGFANLVSHIVAIPAPMIAEITEPFPFIVFVLFTIFAGICTLFIKEI